jgi:plasmid replication initiation protein
MTHPPLSPDRHRQLDFFVADLVDLSPKSDAASLEHPLFALKAGDRRIREYQNGNVQVQVRPGHAGIATIHDKDLWIYAISQLVVAADRGRQITRQVRFTAYDFLVATNRGASGRSYERMASALRRLAETRIETNIETGGQRERAGFGLIDSWRVIERDRDDRMVAVEITLPDWLFRSVQARRVLTLDRDYFRLRRPLDRRIYEIARKHAGRQASFSISMDGLHKKSGSASSLKRFRHEIKALADSDHLPGYRIRYSAKSDRLTVYNRSERGSVKALKDSICG